MESSYKIIKNFDVNLKEEQGKVINTSLETKNNIKPCSTEDNEDLLREDLRIQVKQEMEKERQAILEKARQEAEDIKEELKEKFSEKGYKDGYQKGYEDGNTQGLNQGINESLNIKKGAVDMVSQSEDYVKEYFKENKENLLELSAVMAESIVHEVIDTSDENIMMILEPILREYVHKENIIVTCHPDNFENLRDNIKELEELAGGNKIVILRDSNLEKNGCTLENNKQVMDLQVKTQLENILKDMVDME